MESQVCLTATAVKTAQWCRRGGPTPAAVLRIFQNITRVMQEVIGEALRHPRVPPLDVEILVYY